MEKSPKFIAIQAVLESASWVQSECIKLNKYKFVHFRHSQGTRRIEHFSQGAPDLQISDVKLWPLEVMQLSLLGRKFIIS